MTAHPTLFCLPGLGMSRALFEPLAPLLDADIVAIDLPGFGGTSCAAGTSVEAMADVVTGAIAAARPAHWLLVGHSMGGKIASVVARRALDGRPGLFGLAGVVLLAGSPPTPEPMDDDKRAEMLSWVDGGSLDAAAARSFVDANVGAALPTDLDARATADVRRSEPEAWRAWLERGSREDWSTAVGTLDVPTLIIAGTADADLGAAAQPRLNGPVYPRARYANLDGAGHLLPFEHPGEVAEAIATFWRTEASRGPGIDPAWIAAFASPRTSERTRAILARRALADNPSYRPTVLSLEQLGTLRLLADLVVPQDDPSIDLAARVEAQLAAGEGDGWRPDGLPADDEAYRLGLDALADLAELDDGARHERIAAIVAGEFDPPGDWSPAMMAAWFEDARNDLVRQWVVHPAAMARLGFDGYLTGSGGRALFGWQLLAAGAREAWEPAASSESA